MVIDPAKVVADTTANEMRLRFYVSERCMKQIESQEIDGEALLRDLTKAFVYMDSPNLVAPNMGLSCELSMRPKTQKRTRVQRFILDWAKHDAEEKAQSSYYSPVVERMHFTSQALAELSQEIADQPDWFYQKSQEAPMEAQMELFNKHYDSIFQADNWGDMLAQHFEQTVPTQYDHQSRAISALLDMGYDINAHEKLLARRPLRVFIPSKGGLQLPQPAPDPLTRREKIALKGGVSLQHYYMNKHGETAFDLPSVKAMFDEDYESQLSVMRDTFAFPDSLCDVLPHHLYQLDAIEGMNSVLMPRLSESSLEELEHVRSVLENMPLHFMQDYAHLKGYLEQKCTMRHDAPDFLIQDAQLDSGLGLARTSEDRGRNG